MITALTAGIPIVLVALAVLAMRMKRRREEQAIRERFRAARESWPETDQDEAIRPFSDRPDFADWADELREPS